MDGLRTNRTDARASHPQRAPLSTSTPARLRGVAGRSVGLIAATLAALTTAPLFAQDGASASGPSSSVRTPRVTQTDITGRDFAGVRFQGAPQKGGLAISAQRANVWSEGAGGFAVGSGAGAGSCERLYLQGDVRIELGSYKFTAARAVLWIQRVETTASGPISQVAICFDRVADPGAEAGFSQAADRLLVTGLISPAATTTTTSSGPMGAPPSSASGVSLRVDRVTPERPLPTPVGFSGTVGGSADAFVIEAESRLAEQLKRLLGIATPDSTAAITAEINTSRRRAIEPGLSRPYEPNSPLLRSAQVEVPQAIPVQASPFDSSLNPADALFSNDGILTFAVGTQRGGEIGAGSVGVNGTSTDGQPAEIKLIRGAVPPTSPTDPSLDSVNGDQTEATGEENALLLTGGVVLQYQDIRKVRDLQISAQRAVVFLSPGPLTQMTRFSIKDVKGIYIEGDVVATDGQYTLRGPRVYYDVQKNQALMVDAVFFTFDPKLQQPIYIRAKELRQRAANQFSATDARLAMTSFFDPVLSMGASSVTITQRPDPTSPEAAQAGGGGSSQARSYLDAKGVSLRFADLPFFWLPRYRGNMEDQPLEDFRIENSSGSGAALKTGWNLFGLLGVERPEDLRSRLLLDYFFDRGAAIGTRTSWQNDKHEGDVFGYLLPDDNGEDVLSSGTRRGRDGEVRGMILAKDTWNLDRNWTLFSEGSYISDENFVDAFFRNLGINEREFENSLYLRYLNGNSGFTAQAKGSFNDFTANQYLLTSQGYTVDKLPEFAYHRVADDIFSRAWPGMLTWTHEYRASRMQLNFTEPTADELGFNTIARSRAALGLDPNQSPADFLRAAGLSESEVMRFDTRQELTGNIDFGLLKATPFLVGRFTAYDDSFEDFNGEDQSERFFYAAGTRLSTQITSVNNNIESDFFDLHRTRHIIEPNVTVWYGGSTLNQTELPVYDDRVESLATGSTIRAGVTQTWQTQRGGPGRWRSVDWLTVSTDIVYSTDDVDRESPIGRFFDWRPEYSFLGDYATIDAAWQVTDSVALSTNYVYDLDINQPARTSAGGTIQHTPDFSTYGEVRYINALDTTYVDGGIAYDLTRRYSVTASATYDTDEGDFQSIGGTVRRKMRETTLGFALRYDNIRSETSFGFIIEPNIGAARDRGLRLQEIGR